MPALFFEKFIGSFDLLFEVLGDGLLASYLLGRDQVVSGQLSVVSGQVEFAEEDFFKFDVAPKKAIEYFRKKKVVTRKEFDDLRDEARASAFTVGGVYRDDVLEGFKKEITRSLEEGTPQRETIKRFREILDGASHQELGAFHLETVFRTNMQVAYGVGRRQAFEEVADALPLWQYHAVLDDRTRPQHRALDGLILPADHEFWNEHYPPWGFNCRCTVTATAKMPGDYNHQNPSGVAELVYDKRGLPAKAEVGTAVYDLSVGKFKGIPPQGSLGDVIEAGAKRAKENRK